MAILTAVGAGVIVVVNTAITVVLTRFFRLRLDTDWAAAIYTLCFVPIALTVSTVLLSGLLALGGAVERDVALLLSIVLPLSLGVSIDLFWMPAPEEIQVPDTT